MIAARYADGRAATTHDVQIELGATNLIVHGGPAPAIWNYAAMARGDDGNGQITLKRVPDNGERLFISWEDAAALQHAPHLFTPRAHGVERPVVVWSLTAVAVSLAAIFLIGVPLFAGPIADALPQGYRDRVSQIAWGQVDTMGAYCDGGYEGEAALDDLAYRIAEASNVPQRDYINVNLLNSPIPNAFALPDNSIVITSGLIALAEHPDELAGVLAHEIAHVERNHVLKNIIGNVGAGIFFDIIFGGAGIGQVIAIASVNLAGLRYSRGFEEEADARALDYLDAANIDPGGIARIFERLQRFYEAEAGGLPALLSTHPDSADRGARAQARAQPSRPPALDAVQWALVRSACTVAAPEQ